MINKKVFALTLVAASVIAAGCSSDDDDDPEIGDNIIIEPGAVDVNGDGDLTAEDDLTGDGILNLNDFAVADTDGDGVLSEEEIAAVVAGQGTDPGTDPEQPTVVYPDFDAEGNSVADVIAGDERLGDLAAIVPPALLAQLDYTEAKRAALDTDTTDDTDDAGDVIEDVGDDVDDVIDDTDTADADELPEVVDYTVFAPSNEALAAADLAGVTGEELSNVLLGHVVQGESLPSVAIGDTFTAANGTTIMITDNGTGGPVINDTINFVTDGTTEAENGYVHIIDMVILPPEGSTPPDETDPETPPAGNAEFGPGFAAIEANGNSEFVSIYRASGFGEALETNAWTVFVPSNDAIDDGVASSIAADPDQATAVIQDHVLTEGAFGPDELPASTTSNGGVPLNINSTEDGITVNGFTATQISADDSMSIIYEIDGLLQ